MGEESVRKEDWPEQLSEAITTAKNTRFEWGKNDCCLFAADVVQAITGTDFATEFRGRYRTSRGAARMVKSYGGLRALVSTKLDEIPVSMAMRGDVVGSEQPLVGLALGICMGSESVFTGPDGLVQIPTMECDIAWRVV